jgi:hypothetical protein
VMTGELGFQLAPNEEINPRQEDRRHGGLKVPLC